MSGRDHPDSALPAQSPNTRWITAAVALLATLVFACSGAQLVPGVVLSIRHGTPLPPTHITAFLLNIALVLLAWRRSSQLKVTRQTLLEVQNRAYNLAYYDEVTGLFQHAPTQGAELLAERYEEMKPADVADELHEMESRRRLQVAAALSDEQLADVLEELPEDDQVAILAGLEIDRAADVLEEMQPDDATDLLRELPDERMNELLAAMEPDEAADVRRLLAYEDRSAGGLMTTEPVILGPETSIAAAPAHPAQPDADDELPPSPVSSDL